MSDAYERSRRSLLEAAKAAPVRDGFIPLLEETIEFVDNVCEPRSNEAEKLGRIPEDVLEQMRERRHFGFTMAREYGGHGLTSMEYIFICMAYGRTNVAFPLMININNGLGSRGIVYYGTEEQKRRYLKNLASGQVVAFCLTEPDAGSDAAGIRTTAEKQGDKWVINGKKHFITNAPVADVFIVYAVTDEKKRARGGITAFIVDRDNPGLRIGREQFFMGAGGSPTSEVFFENCFVDESMVCGDVGFGFNMAMQSIDYSRLTIGARHTHSAELLLEMSVDWAKSRHTFGKPLGDHQAIKYMLADMATDVHLGRLLVMDTALRYDAGDNVNSECAMVKMFGMEMANRVVDRALQIHGGKGYSKDLPIERFYRDLRGPMIWDGSMEMQREVIGKRLLKGAINAAPPKEALAASAE